jgi:hypothetical protein
MEQKLILRLDLGTIPGYLIMWKLQNLWKKKSEFQNTCGSNRFG